MSGQDNENVYYNIRIINDQRQDPLEALKPAIYSETRVLPILKRPVDYELAVVRFKVPTSSIPLIIWEEGAWKMAMEYNGSVVSQDMVYTGGAGPYGLAIYSYNRLAQIFNGASESVFQALLLLEPGLPGFAPQLEYDPVTRLYSLYFDPSWDSLPGVIPIITVNSVFEKLIAGISSSFVPGAPEGQEWIIECIGRISNQVTINGTPYIMMQQEYSTVSVISNLNSIVFQTDRIPVAGEYLTSFQRDVTGAIVSTGSSNITRSILTDFEPLGGIEDTTDLQFFPQGPLRYYPLKNTDELRTIDVKIFWEDKEQNQYPLFLAPGDVATIKLQFRRKKEILLREQMEGEFSG